MPQVTTTKVVEGAANLIIRVDLLNNDASGELDNYVILSPSDCVPPRSNNKPNFRIMQIWYGMVWFDVVLKYGTLSPEPIWTLTRDSGNFIDFRGFGGVVDTETNPPGDENGKLVISTNGFSAPGSQGHLIIALRKKT